MDAAYIAAIAEYQAEAARAGAQVNMLESVFELTESEIVFVKTLAVGRHWKSVS